MSSRRRTSSNVLASSNSSWSGRAESGGLGRFNVADGTALRERLVTCDNPMKEIGEFQGENSIRLKSLESILPLVDLHGMSRAQLTSDLLSSMQKWLLNEVEAAMMTASPSRHSSNRTNLVEKLVEKCFPLITVAHFRPMVFSIAQQVKKLDRQHLQLISNNPDLYDACPTAIKRQIWHENHELFGRQVDRCLSVYLAQFEHYFSCAHRFEGDSGPDQQLVFGGRPALVGDFDPAYSSQENLLAINSKVRRQRSDCCQQLTNMVGESVELYRLVVERLAEEAGRSELHGRVCSALRNEFIMALHEAERLDVCNEEETYKFAWCLDAASRDQLTSQRAVEMNGFLNGIKRTKLERIVLDSAMVLADPFILASMANSLVRRLAVCLDGQLLPREDGHSIILYRLLSLGLKFPELLAASKAGTSKSALSVVEPSLSFQVPCNLLCRLAIDLAEQETCAISTSLGKRKKPKHDAIMELFAESQDDAGSRPPSAKRAKSASSSLSSSSSWSASEKVDDVGYLLIGSYALHLLSKDAQKDFCQISKLLTNERAGAGCSQFLFELFLYQLAHGVVSMETTPSKELLHSVVELFLSRPTARSASLLLFVLYHLHKNFAAVSTDLLRQLLFNSMQYLESESAESAAELGKLYELMEWSSEPAELA